MHAQLLTVFELACFAVIIRTYLALSATALLVTVLNCQSNLFAWIDKIFVLCRFHQNQLKMEKGDLFSFLSFSS